MRRARGGSVNRTRRIGAIDIGTVTVRLLIADVTANSIEPVVRSTDITHLGEGLTQTGRLSDAAMARVAGVVGRYADQISTAGVDACTAIATSASRDATNGEDFLGLLAAEGIEPQIIDGDREARLAFLGATHGLTGRGLLVVDLGGGSTELVVGDVVECDGRREESIAAARSIDVGSKRVTEIILHGDPPTPSELDAARTWIADEIRPYFDALRQPPTAMFAVAGTATTLSAIKLGMAVYDPDRIHGSRLTRRDLAELLSMLAVLPLDERKHVVGLDPGRAPVIVAGALELETVLALAGLDSATTSEHDILHGILVDTWRRLEDEASQAD
ncbi:MAG: Ppx/GppA family phosphatase [Coriobacteriales bacterium]|nr:Ppx/GppA family phosphatase [Coriobacteriales bacterium]